jgi:hypothetical protein
MIAIFIEAPSDRHSVAMDLVAQETTSPNLSSLKICPLRE